MVGGYMRKRVTLRISKGLRAIALAAGISRRVYSDTQVIFNTIIAIYIALAEKIGTPLIRVGHGTRTWPGRRKRRPPHNAPTRENLLFFTKNGPEQISHTAMAQFFLQ
jgi:hypothetical protein